MSSFGGALCGDGKVEAVVIENNVTDFVLSKAKVTEKAISFDELMDRS